MKISNLERIDSEGYKNLGNETEPPVQTVAPLIEKKPDNRNETERYLALRKKRSNMTIEERADARVQAVQKMYLKEPTVNTSSFGAAAKTGVAAPKGEELVSKLNSLSTSFGDAQTVMVAAQSGLTQAENAVKTASEKLRQAQQGWAANPTEENVGRFRTALTEYNNAYNTYSSAHNAYSKAYDAYKVQEEEMVNALADYKIYYNQQQAAYESWMQTDEYKAWQEQQAAEKEMVDLDLNAYKAETEELENFAQLIEDTNITNWYDIYSRGVGGNIEGYSDPKIVNEKLAIWNRFKSQYDADLGQLEAEIARRKLYLRNAQRVDERVRLESVADPNSAYYNPNFAQLSAEVAGETYPDLYQYMTDDQKAVYRYHKKMYGDAGAERYLATIKSNLEYKKAEAAMKPLEGNYLADLGIKAAAGLDQFGSGVAELWNSIVGKEEIQDPTMLQMAGQIAQKDLGNMDMKWYNFADGTWNDAKLGDKSLGQVAGDLVTTGANMAPSILASAIPVAGKYLGPALMGLSAGGNAYQEAINSGYSAATARSYGIVTGASEAVLERLLGGIPGLSDQALAGVGQKLLKAIGKADSGILKFCVDVGANAVSEGMEEGLQSVLEPMFQEVILNADADIDWGEVAYSALLGLLTGGMMESVKTGTLNAAEKHKVSAVTKKLVKLYRLKTITESDAQEIINSGLESAKGAESYKLATQLKAKLDAGTIPGAKELGQLLYATELEIQKENTPGLSILRGAEPEGLSLPTLEDVQNDIAPSLGVDASDPMAGLSLPTLEDVTQNAPSVTERGGNVTPAIQSVTADPQNVTENQMINTAVPAGDAVPVAAQSGESQNGGTPYVNTQVRRAGPAAAQPAGGSTGAGGNGLLSGGGQRNAGASAGEQAGSLAGRTGAAAQGRDSAFANRVRAAVARENLARDLRIQKVSSTELGFVRGTENKNLQILPQEHWDGELQGLAQRIREETGKEPVFVIGEIRVRGKDGKTFPVRAAITDDQVIQRADYTHKNVSLEQILDHEIFHYKERSAREDGYDLNAMIEERILESYTQEEFNKVLDAYIDALDGRFGLSEAESAAQYEAALAKIKTELFADAYAGINAFGVNADQFTGAVDQRLDQLHMGRNTAQENGVRQTNGPPAAKENTADVGGESYSADIQEKRRIIVDMSDAERTEILRGKSITAPVYKGEADDIIASEGNIESGKLSLAKAALVRIGEEFGVFGDYNIEDVDVQISLSRGNLRESITKDANPVQLARLLPILKDTVQNAIGIENHSNRYFYDNMTESFENLLGGYVDGEYFVPVRFGLKNIKGGETVLYVLVDQQKIKAEVLKTTTHQNDGSTVSRPAFTYSVPQVVSFVNSKDILRYLPDGLLSADQRRVKQEGVAETTEYTNSKNDTKYKKFVSAGNVQAARGMINAAAKAAGYSASDDWRMAHKAPNQGSGVSLDQADEVYGSDGSIYSAMAHQYYGEGRSYDAKAIRAFVKAWQDPDGNIAVYRAVPSDVQDTRLRNGDWVTPTREYAEEHGARTFEDGYRVIAQSVPVKYLFVDGNSIHEFGYDNGRSTEVYRNTGNNVKLAEITYDDDGNLIPISRRFDETVEDERFSADDQTEAEIAAKEELIAALQELTPEQLQSDEVRRLIEQYTTRPQPKLQTPALKIDRANLRRALNSTLGLTKEQSGQLTQVLDKFTQDVKPKRAAKPKAELDVQSKPTEAKKILQKKLLDLFSVPAGQRGAMGNFINNFADRIVKNGKLTEADRKAFFTAMYEAGAMTVPADEYYANARSYIKGGHIFVPDSVVADFGDDWGEIRRRAFAAGIYLTRSQVNENGQAVSGIDAWNNDLASELPGLFNSEETDRRTMLEQIVRVAEMGREEKMSLGEYVARIAGEEYTSENDVLDSMERQMTWALKSFAETARVEIELKDNNLRRVLKERQENREVAQRAKDRKELQDLQKKTMKQLQWLSRNRYKAPEDLQAVWDEVLGDIDLYAIGAANEMNWSEKYGATWKDLAAMYKAAKESDPNFMPSEELEKIITRLDAKKIGDMDLGALQDLYKAAVGLRTEFYNRNNVVGDEMHRLFAEVYTDAKNEIQNAPGGFTGKWADKFVNMDQLTPMNVLQRMGGWDPDGVFYSMAKQLEHGERDMRAYQVKAQRLLQEFLTEHEDWVKKADGQGKNAIWYEIEVPELLELHMGDKPIFGDTVKVYMTPSQKVHLYLESKNLDNLRHMTGGRTFVNKELYSKGKRQEALAQGRTIRLAPETVKAIVSDLTAEELELAQLLEQYYNVFAKDEINRVSNTLYGYDKAMGKNYAPIYTNRNYTKAEFGVFDVTAEGVGNLKGRQHASNPSYNLSAFDAFERHSAHTARFVGMAIPARNWTTLMGWQERGNSTGDVITHKWGEEGKRYIEDLITTLQAGDDLKTDTVSKVVNKLQSNYISAVFGANLGIVLKQLGSIPLAGAYLGASNVPRYAQIAKIDADLISRYTQDLAWRTMGYTTPETKQLKENPNWTETNKVTKFAFGGGAITAMDGWAASTLWPWAENKVRKDYPDLEIGTAEQIAAGESPFYKKVAELFEEAVARSQSVSDEIHQSSLRKSKNPITRAFTLFRSDSAQTYNTLRQKIGEAQFYKRTGADEKVKKAATTAVGTVVCALLMNAVWSEAVSFLMAMWKNKGKYYRDDEEKLTAESVVGEMGRNMIESIMGTVTFGDEIAQLIGNAIAGDQRYDLEAPGLEQLNEILNLIQDLLQGNFGRISEAVDLVKNGGNLEKYIGDNGGDILGEIKETAIKAATYFGVPINNMEAYLIGALKWVSPELGAAYDDLFIDAGKSDLSGMEGGALEARVRGILKDRHMSESENTAQILAGLYEGGYTSAMPSDIPSSVTVNEEKHELNEYQKQIYDEVWGDIVADGLDDLVSSEAFAGADQETQAKMLARLYSYAADRAKAELFDQYSSSSAKTVDQMRAEGVGLADCISWSVESSGLKQEEKFALLREWDLTDGQKKAVVGTILGTDLKTAAGNPTQYAEMLEALENGLTVDQYIDLRTGGGVGDYSDLVEGGLNPDEAYELVEDWNNLQPADGKDSVSDLQKWRVCVDFSDDVDDQLTALFAVMTEKQFQKVEIANDFGVTPNAYVTLLELRSKYDVNGNGSYTQAEIKRAIDNLPGRYTTAQKAVLWQLVTGSSSAKNNPYDQKTGQKVLAAKSGSAGSSSGSSSDFSAEIMKQLVGE